MLIFQNPGLIPEDTITTMGVSAKLGENPIGVFGTGLKYAIAIILRHGGKVSVWKGKKELVFTLAESVIRGKEFRIVCMNGKKLGYTDHLGMNWMPWMAYRELYSNCKDEGGTIRQFVHSGEELGEAKMTKIVVEWPELEKIHENRHQIILSTEPMYTLEGLEVHPGVDAGHLYYKRIRVMDMSPQAKYTYSISSMQSLTEDRTLLYPSLVPGIISKAIVKCTNKHFLRDILDTQSVEHRYEAKINYEYAKNEKPSIEFLEVSEELKAAKRLVSGAASLFNHFQDTLPGHVSPYVISEFSEAEHLLIDQAVETVQVKFPDLERRQIVFKTKQHHRVSTSQNVMILNSELLKQGKMRIAFAIVEGLALLNKGGIAEQMACHILTGAWIPEELVEQYAKTADNYGSMF